MTIEQSLENCATALHALAEALVNNAGALHLPAIATPDETRRSLKKVLKTAQSHTLPLSSSTDQTGPTVNSYELAAIAIRTLAQQKGRDVAVALLGQFGAARLPDVPADNLGEVTAAANKALGMAA